MQHPERGQRTPFGLVTPRFRPETIPLRHLRDRIAEESEIAVGVKRLSLRILDRVLQVLFEVLETEPCRINRAAQKGLLDERF